MRRAGAGLATKSKMALQRYKELTKEELENIPSDCKQAAHVMIYTKMDKKLFGLYPITNTIMVSRLYMSIMNIGEDMH